MTSSNTGSPSGDRGCDQPASRERQAGPYGVTERPVVLMKPGNAGGGKGPQLKGNARSNEGGGIGVRKAYQQELPAALEQRRTRSTGIWSPDHGPSTHGVGRSLVGKPLTNVLLLAVHCTHRGRQFTRRVGFEQVPLCARVTQTAGRRLWVKRRMAKPR